MPRTEEANRRIREEQRTKILQAAWKVFARKGMATTMADVAAEASISQGLAYRYFTNKEAIFNALLEQIEQTMQSAQEVQSFDAIPGTASERIELMVSSIMESRRKHPEFFQVFYLALNDALLPAHIRTLIEQRGQFMQNMLRQLIVEGQATGEVIAGDPDQLVLAVMACIEGIWRAMVTSTPEQIMKHMPNAEIILRMIKPYSHQS